MGLFLPLAIYKHEKSSPGREKWKARLVITGSKTVCLQPSDLSSSEHVSTSKGESVSAVL